MVVGGNPSLTADKPPLCLTGFPQEAHLRLLGFLLVVGFNYIKMQMGREREEHHPYSLRF